MNLFLFLHLVFVTLLLRAEAQAKTCCKHCSCQAQCALFIAGVTSLWQLLSTSIVLGLTWLAVLSGLTSRWTAIRCLTTIGSIAALVSCLARIKLLVGDIDRHVLVIWRNRNFWNGCGWFVTKELWVIKECKNFFKGLAYMLRKPLTYCSTNIKVKYIKAVSYVGLRFVDINLPKISFNFSLMCIRA